LINKEQGTYTITLFNINGQSVQKKEIKHTGGSATEMILLPENLVPGSYKLELRSSAGKKEVLNVTVL
jgi:hypothetical protein